MKLSIKLVLYLSIVTLIVMSPILFIIWNHQRNILFEQAKIQANTVFEMIVVTRQWVAENRNRIEPVPAVATKELSIYAGKLSNFKFHITSDVLVNPENAPDEFEKRALKLFQLGETEVEEITYDKNLGKVYRYMAPLFINESCLSCHDYQGYKIGDLRGGISVYIPLKDLEKSILNNNILFYGMSFILYTTLLLSIVVLLHQLILKYIKKLSISAKAIHNEEKVTIPIFKTNDEIQELSEAFSQMYNKIIKNEENLKIKLKEAISEYIKIYEELLEKHEELKKANKFKTDIIDALAHEIRTPMTKIISYSDILINNNTDKETEEIAKGVILKNTRYLNKLFNQFLLLTKLEYSAFNFNWEKLNLKYFIDKWIEHFKDEIEQKNLSVTNNVSDEITIYSDEILLDHIISNLLSNAIKYNTEHGEIEIDAQVKGDFVEITFGDTGFGIKEDEREKIFERFYRSDTVKKYFSGTGLGLSIVYRILKEMKGSIKVDSVYGKYSKFIITIPLKLGRHPS